MGFDEKWCSYKYVTFSESLWLKNCLIANKRHKRMTDNTLYEVYNLISFRVQLNRTRLTDFFTVIEACRKQVRFKRLFWETYNYKENTIKWSYSYTYYYEIYSNTELLSAAARIELISQL